MKLSRARIALVLLLLLALVPAAHADGLMLNDLLTGLSSKRNGWLAGIRDFSAWLFYFMAVTGAVWTFGMLLLRGPDFSEFFVTFTRFCIMVALFGWLLDVVPGDFTPANGSDAGSGLAMGLDGAMQTLSRKMTGEAPSPDGMLHSGWQMLDAVIKASDGNAVSDKQYGMLSNMAIVAMIALALAAVNIVLLSVTLWILAYAGVFLLGFAGARWSSNIAIGYFKTVLAVVVSLLALRLVAVVAAAQIDMLFASQVNGRLTLQGVAMMMVLSVAVAVIMTRLPGLLSSAILGASVARGGAYSVSVQALAAAGTAVSSSSQSMREDARQAYERLARTSAGTTESNSRLYDTAVPSPVMPTYANVTAPYGNYASLQFRGGNGFEPGTGGGAAPPRSNPAVVVSPQSSPESSDWTRSTWASRQRDPGQDAVFDTSVEQRRHRAGTPVASVGGAQGAAPMWQEPARQERRQAANTAAAAGSSAAHLVTSSAGTRVDSVPQSMPGRDVLRDGVSTPRTSEATRDDHRPSSEATTLRRRATTMDDALLQHPGVRRSEQSDTGRDAPPSQTTADTRLRQQPAPGGGLPNALETGRVQGQMPHRPEDPLRGERGERGMAGQRAVDSSLRERDSTAPAPDRRSTVHDARPSDEQGPARAGETRLRQHHVPGGGLPNALETGRVQGQMPHRPEDPLRGERGERGMAGQRTGDSSLRERDSTAPVPDRRGTVHDARPSDEQGPARAGETRLRQYHVPGGGPPNALETGREQGQMPHRPEEPLRAERGMAGARTGDSSLRERDSTAPVPGGKRGDAAAGRQSVGELHDERARVAGGPAGSSATPSPDRAGSDARTDATPSSRTGDDPARRGRPAPSGSEPAGSAGRREDEPASPSGQPAGKAGGADAARVRDGGTPPPGERRGYRAGTPQLGDTPPGAARDGTDAPRARGGDAPPSDRQPERTGPARSTDGQTGSRGGPVPASSKGPHGTAPRENTADGRSPAGGKDTTNERGREPAVGTRDVPAQRGQDAAPAGRSGAPAADAPHGSGRRPGRLLGELLGEDDAARQREQSSRHRDASRARGRNVEPIDDEDEIARFRDGGNGGEEGAP